MAMADLADRGKLVCPTSGYLSLAGKFKRETVQDRIAQHGRNNSG